MSERTITYKGDRLFACTREELTEALLLLLDRLESDRRTHSPRYTPHDEITETLELLPWRLSIESDVGMRYTDQRTVYARTAKEVEERAAQMFGADYSIGVRPL